MDGELTNNTIIHWCRIRGINSDKQWYSIFFTLTLCEKRFVATGQVFLGATGDGAAPTVACSRATRSTAPTNGTAGAAGDTSRPYKWIDL